MSEELNCQFLSDAWCVFDEPCNECRQIENRYGRIEKRIEELEAENRRLREALKEITEFANDEYERRIPAPSSVTFRTIKLWAEKALKGVNHGQQKI